MVLVSPWTWVTSPDHPRCICGMTRVSQPKSLLLVGNHIPKQFVLRVGEIWYPKVEPRCKPHLHITVCTCPTMGIDNDKPWGFNATGYPSTKGPLTTAWGQRTKLPPALNSYTMKNQVSMYTLVFLLLHRSCTTTTTQTPHYSHLVIITGTDIPAGFAWVFPQVRVRVREFRTHEKPVPVAGNPWLLPYLDFQKLQWEWFELRTFRIKH